ncbi:MAG: T9SS type A sorting domain-containing protein [Bacteroidota bacterium]
MKKNLLLSACIALSGLLSAQISTSVAMAWAPGDVFTTYSADTTGVQEGPAGANQTWNFSNLVISTSPSTSTCVAPSTTPYAASFPSATVAAGANGGYSYYQVSSGSTIYHGLGVPNQTQVYSDPEIMITYPFTYNTTVTDNFGGTWMISSIQNTRSGTSTTTGDGYGTLILPSGTFNNVLRVKLVQNYSDVSLAGTIQYNFEIYYWFNAVDKDPLLSVQKWTITQFSTTSYTKVVFVSDAVAGFADNDHLSPRFDLFPNPASSPANISFALEGQTDVSCTVYSLTGQQVYNETYGRLQAGTHSFLLNTGELESGIYFVSVEMNGVRTQRKLVVE